jgi:hypothetical protein
METQGLSEEEAKAQARQSIDPQFAEVREAKKLEELAAKGRSITDELIVSGVPAQRAQAVGMLQVAQRLNDAGLNQEATTMRAQASELLQAQQKKEEELSNLQARTAASIGSEERADATLAADDDTFIKIDDNGAISDTRSMPITAEEERQELRDQGYINVGNAAFGVQFTREDFAGAPKEVPRGTQEDIIGGLNMLSSIDILRSINSQTGFIEGPARSMMARLGITAFDNEGFVEATAVRRKMRADIQSIIKGIPSNYDAGIFEAMIPDPGAFKSETFYNAQLDVLENSTRELVKLTIEFHKGTQKPIPKSVLDAAFMSGIRVDDLAPMDSDEVAQIKNNPDNNVFTAHQKNTQRIQTEFMKTTQDLRTPEEIAEEDADLNFFFTE